MTTLVIPDIHTAWQRADTILHKESYDQAVCLGDYHDEFGDNPETNRKMALWLKESLTKGDRIHLWGNHDIHYAFPMNPFVKCSGYTNGKCEAINSVLKRSDWDKLHFFCVVDGWLLTHGGLHKSYANQENPIETLIFENKLAKKCLANEDMHWFYMAGFARGGIMQRYGGILWCDADREFVAVPGLKQIFGHTPGKTPRWVGDGQNNLALDTHLNHYCLINDGKVIVKAYADL